MSKPRQLEGRNRPTTAIHDRWRERRLWDRKAVVRVPRSVRQLIATSGHSHRRTGHGLKLGESLFFRRKKITLGAEKIRKDIIQCYSDRAKMFLAKSQGHRVIPLCPPVAGPRNTVSDNAIELGHCILAQFVVGTNIAKIEFIGDAGLIEVPHLRSTQNQQARLGTRKASI